MPTSSDGNMTAGLTLPSLTVADPPVSGEGSLDRLGTAALADRIAEELVPDVRARMSRIRFLTAMAVASIVTNEAYRFTRSNKTAGMDNRIEDGDGALPPGRRCTGWSRTATAGSTWLMGEQIDTSEWATERAAERVPLPASLAASLTFDLSVVGSPSPVVTAALYE